MLSIPSMNVTHTENYLFDNLLFAIRGHQLAAMIHLAARWQIADNVGEGRSLAALAQQLSVDEAALGRMLRALAAFGIFEVGKNDFVVQSAMSRLLMRDAPKSLHAAAVFWGMRCFWPAWGNLDHAVREGKSSFEHLVGTTLFDHLSANADDCAAFDDFMARSPDQRHEATVQAYSFDGFETIADIGGGNGRQLAAILKATPASRGLLYDRPDVVKGAIDDIAVLERDGRCSVIAGNFFESVPAGADAYLLSQIIHDWDDASALGILHSCKAAMGNKGTLLLIERLDEPDTDNVCTGNFLSDMEMLVLHGAAERSIEQYRQLLEETGFTLRRVIQTSSPFSIIEAVSK